MPTDVYIQTEDGEAKALQSETVSGVVDIRLPERSDIREVAFYLDDLPEFEGAEPAALVNSSPFGLTLDTAELEDGPHTIALYVTYDGLTTEAFRLIKISFKVFNGDRRVNRAPHVRAGPSLSVAAGTEVEIAGSVRDDGRPNGELTVRWSLERGPAEPNFSNPNMARTTVSFPEAGTYRLRLTANDGQKSSSDTVRVRVTAAAEENTAPTVDAGRDLLVTLPNVANLSGVASDDGLPTGKLSLRWEVVQGPGSVQFGDETQGTTTAKFSRSGNYILSLTADDGELSTTDTIRVAVEAEPAGPGEPSDPPVPPADPDPTEPTDPDPKEPTDPDPKDPTPPSGPRKLEMIGNPSFDVRSLPSSTQVWYNRFLAALDNPSPYPDVESDARSGDLYKLGRTVSMDVTTTLTVFRFTGDLRLLDYVDNLMQLARAELRDTNGDGYPNWRWLTDRNDRYYGDDYHVMDEMMTHGMLAQVAWAYRQNQDLRSPAGVDYKERAEFWSDYLQQWERKWRERNRRSTGFPFIQKDLTHPEFNIIRYHWYSYRLTGDQGYLQEANRLANEMNSRQLTQISTPNGAGLVFPHGIVRRVPSLNYLAPINYARYSTQVLMDLALEPFAPFTIESTLIPIANTIATKVIDNGSTDFAPTIGGSQAIGGIGYPSGSPARTPASRWAFYPLSEYAAFDKSDKIASVNEQVYNSVERSRLERPQRKAIPAAMIINDLIKESLR